jgi:hypothetical protein
LSCWFCMSWSALLGILIKQVGKGLLCRKFLLDLYRAFTWIADIYLVLIGRFWSPWKFFEILIWIVWKGEIITIEKNRRNFSLAWHSRFRIRRRNFGLHSIGSCHCLIKSVREIFFFDSFQFQSLFLVWKNTNTFETKI